MNGQDIGAGIGLILAGVGTLIIVIVRSAWAERQARKAERTITRQTVALVTPKRATGIDELWLELLATSTPSVPSQRRPGDLS